MSGAFLENIDFVLTVADVDNLVVFNSNRDVGAIEFFDGETILKDPFAVRINDWGADVLTVDVGSNERRFDFGHVVGIELYGLV